MGRKAARFLVAGEWRRPSAAPVVAFLPRAARPELAVARVAQARQDVAHFVELAVDGRTIDLDVWVSGRDRIHALRRHDEIDEHDPRRSPDRKSTRLNSS